MITIRNLEKIYDHTPLYRHFNLDIMPNKITCFFGPSGIGKTTLLKMLSGILKPDSGIITGVESTRISYVFQESRLIPWYTVYENMEYVLKTPYPDKAKRDQLIIEYLSIVEMAHVMDAYPNELSGGMKQRLSIARAFAYPSEILLMDEPFNSLDINLRNILFEVFIRLFESSPKTVLFITHQIDEALLLGHTIHVLNGKPVKIKHTSNLSQPLSQRVLSQQIFHDAKNQILSHLSDD